MNDQDSEPSISLIGHLVRLVRRRARHSRAWAEQFGEFQIALTIVAIIPIFTVLAGALLLLKLERENGERQQAEAKQIAAIATAQKAAVLRSMVAPLFSRPTLTILTTKISGALPPNAHIRLLSMDREGRLEVQLDCSDPESLVTVFERDALLGTLHMVDQAPADEGIRITLRSGHQ